MECFTVLSNEIEGRIDSHFYRPEFKELKSKLSKLKHKSLGDIIEFSSETWNQKDFFDNQFPYIEISEIDTSTGEIKNITYYEKDRAPSRAKMIVRENDIIVSTTRPHRGAIALIDKTKDGFIASTGFAILRNLKIDLNKKYLFFILRTQLSLKQMLQRSSGGNYPAITVEELKKVIIPLPSLSTQEKIVNLMESANFKNQQKQSQAQQLLDSINDYVLDELGIKLPELKDKTTYVVDSEKVEKNRCDAYYYQPKFEEVEKAVKNGKFEVKEINGNLDILNRLENLKDYPYINYVDLASINKDLGLIKNYNKLTIEEAPSRARQKLEKGDLLISGLVGSLKSIAIFEGNFDNAICSTGFYVIKSSNKYNNYYLWALFRSPIFQMILQRESSGAIMSAINREAFLSIKIPLPPLSVQNKIADEVKKRMQKAEELEKEAKEELEKAKQEVEKIILGE